MTPTTPPTPEATPDATPTPAAAAPETYAEYTAPEGHKPDPDTVGAANAIFKELGLSQDQAQKLMDLQFQREVALTKAQGDAITQMREEWGNQLKSDPAIGTKLSSVQADIGRALTHLDPKTRDEFQTAMNETGVGNHPAFVKAIYALAQKVNEGQHVAGSPAAVVKPSRPAPAAAMYPHLAQQ